MKIHTSNFKNEIKLLGKEIDSKITFGSTVLGKDDLNSVTPSFQGSILKSVMKELDIDSNVDIPLNTILKYEFGVKVNGEYEYLSFGNYIVYKSEKQEDTNSYRITCYDKMLYSMKEYEKMNITYPITLRNYINAVCSHLGLTFKDKSGTFANYNRTIQNELYIDKDGNSLGYTFRDVFDELAQATASTICINNNDELEIRYINDTGDTIDEEFLKDVNVNFGEKFGAVNTIVLSRSTESDNVYYPETLPTNPYELKIVDNQIMNGNDRADYLPDIYNKLNGLEFYINDFSSTGICYYDLCDRYNVKIGDNIYSCIMFNDEILVTQGLQENVFTDMPKETKTDYTKADKTDRRINQTNLIVDKQNQEIQALVENVKNIKVDTTLTKQASGNPITIEDAGAYPCENFIVEGKSEQDGTPTPDTPIEIETVKGIENYESRYLINKITGKQLFDKNNVTSGYFNTSGSIVNSGSWYYQYIKVQPNKNYVISGIATANPTPQVVEFDKDMNFIQRIMSYRNGVFTTNENTTYIGVSVISTDLNTYQFEENSIATDYEPYKEKIITYDLKKENLFDSIFEKGNIESASGKITHQYDTYSKVTTNIFKVQPNTTYTFKSLGNHNVDRIAYFDSNGNYISRSDIIGSKTFTTIDNCYYIRFNVWDSTSSDNINVDNSKIYEGTGTDDYYEFCEINGTRDELDEVTGVLTKRIGKVVLNGNETWYTNGYSFYPGSNLLIGAKNPIDANTLPDLICSHFTVDTYENVWGVSHKSNTISMAPNGTNNPRINYPTLTTVDEFKTWLSNNPVTVYYVLAEEETIQLEPTNIELFKGTNNIYTLDDLEPNMNITYLTDSKMNAQYATKSELKVESDAINLKVDAKIDDKDLTSAEIIARINKKTGTSEAQINADNINLNGVVTANNNFKINVDGSMETISGKIAGFNIDEQSLWCSSDGGTDWLENTYRARIGKWKGNSEDLAFSVHSNDGNIPFFINYAGKLIASNAEITGKITSTNGRIGGFELAQNEFKTNISVTRNYTQADIEKVQQYLLGQITFTNEEFDYYDANGDGIINILDMIVMQRVILGTDSPTKTGTFEINSTSTLKSLAFKDETGKTTTSVGLEGIGTKNLSADVLSVDRIQRKSGSGSLFGSEYIVGIGIYNTSEYSLGNYGDYDLYIIMGKISSEDAGLATAVLPYNAINQENGTSINIADNVGFVSSLFTLNQETNEVIFKHRARSGSGYITEIYGIRMGK